MTRIPQRAPQRRRATAAAITIAVAFLTACTTVPGEAPKPFPTPFQIIAHRGASAYAPENTIPSFQRALALGAFEVELDVMLTRDDKVVLFHDDTLTEKTGKKGRVRDHTLKQLERLDIGTWFDRTHPEVVKTGRRYRGTRLVSLAKVFQTFGDQLFYHIEIKSNEPELPRLVLLEVERAKLRHRVKITSFSIAQLERVRALDAEMFTSYLIRDEKTLEAEAEAQARSNPNPTPYDDDYRKLELFDLQKKKVDAAAVAGCNQVGIASEDLSKEIIAYARTWNLETRAWRIRSDEDMLRAIEMGASGMTTNWPERLIRELVKHYGSGGGASRR